MKLQYFDRFSVKKYTSIVLNLSFNLYIFSPGLELCVQLVCK